MDQNTSHDQSRPPTLPSIAAMTQGMPGTDIGSGIPQSVDTRDSGNWSMQSPSKHSSTVSSHVGGLNLQTLLNSDDAPSNSSGPATPLSARYPPPNQSLPPLNQPYDSSNRTSLNQPYDSSNRGSLVSPSPYDVSNRASSVEPSNTSFLDSRRSSIESRVNVNMGHLAINPTSSPYESTNHSQTSLSSSVHQRGPNVPAIHSRANGTVPTSPFRTRPRTAGGNPPARQAPPISANPRTTGIDPLASTPTKGYAWAFPDVPEEEDSSSPESSRHGSFAPSINSSIHTTDSTVNTHHHTMQHRSVTNLQPGDLASQLQGGNYSRTPELRVSHKLAERKRRSEMKDLFDQLNRALPNPPGNKSSKWETLSKAIEYIKSLNDAYQGKCQEVAKLQTEHKAAEMARKDNELTQQEIHVMWQQLKRVEPNGHHIYGPKTHALHNSETQSSAGRLPPLQNSQGPPQQHSQWTTPASSNQMQGVEYASQSQQYDRR